MKKTAVICLGLLSVIYLLNPGAGIFELLPDHLPFVGNLDEAAAAALLLWCLKYLGVGGAARSSREREIVLK